MLNKKEILIIVIVTLILAFSISFDLSESLENSLNNFPDILLAVFLVLFLSISAKKIASFYLDCEIEIKLWEITRFGFKADSRFKKPFPSGALFPIFSKIPFFLIKNFAWMGSLIFDVKPKTYRAAKRHGLYSFSEMTEKHMGLIAASGIVVNLIAAILGYLLGFPIFVQINIYYVFFNMIPISNLDGNKIFFGNIVLWSFLAAITLIGMFFAIFII
jgi:hypothetical protein